MKFVKMHGCGNDYVYLDGVTDAAMARRIEEPGWGALVRRMSDRHKGIGSDGVIVLCPPSAGGIGGMGGSTVRVPGAQVRMRMFNADGSEAEMCGNGVRCVAKFAFERLGVRANPMLVETGRGVLSIALDVVAGRVVAATVDMGEPILDLERIPIDAAQLQPGTGRMHHLKGTHTAGPWTFVSMGNPHAVMWMPVELGPVGFKSEAFDDFATIIGPTLERHAAFPNRANIHLAFGASRSSAEMYTWERGAGITQACGTGACAVHVAGVLCGRLDREATIRVLGGELRVRWDEKTNHVFMTGPAADICEGEWLGDRA